MTTKENNTEEMVSVPKWVLEHFEDTLRIQFNIYGCKTDTCQKRNIKHSLILVEKLLSGKKITGMEIIETLI